MDHMALVYMVNKPYVLGKIACWLLLFVKYDFTRMHKPRSKHVVANALSILLDDVKFVRVQNQVVDVVLFIAQLIWLSEV